ncbi:MAG: response regulator [Proteobacteria bacterium]|nr:response regulator [Pseudomonadota bacterium]
MRALDWSKTPLGPVSTWPQSLLTTVSTCLDCAFPILIWWGPELVMLYNDEYTAILGSEKHPAALGSVGREVWPELWDVIGPMLGQVVSAGRPTRSRDLLLLMNRHGYQEETYFSFSYSPIRDETGGVGGVFTPVIETTGKVIGERRLRTLRELAAAAGAASVDGAIHAALHVLSQNVRDVPFAVIYALEDDGTAFRLMGAVGVERGSRAAPEVVPSGAEEDALWPLREALSGGQALRVKPLDRIDVRMQDDRPRPDSALVIPIMPAGREKAGFVLVAGINPLRPLEDEQRAFFDLVAGQIGQALADALALEEERRRAAALAELDRAKTRFFSNVSHEFRTPLTLMLGPLEQLLSGPDLGTDAVREHVETAHRNGMRLLKLVNALLDFSRIEAGRVDASFSPVDLAACTAEIASAFRSLFERAGLDFVVDAHRLHEAVYVDRDLWEKVVLNLVSNAFKFTLEGRVTVTVRPAPTGGGAEVVVADTGVGIPEAELPRVFERFHRVENAQGRSYEGSGIGMALVRELVDLHGGTISVVSRLRAGSAFTVRLPFGAAHLPSDRVRESAAREADAPRRAVFLEEAAGWLEPLESAAAIRSPTADATTARVLLADDSADMRQYLARLLLAEGYEVETAVDGDAALGLARMRPPDLVLADVMMPKLDGLALLRALRTDPLTAETPVILLSARAGEEARVEGLQSGADDYLVKPFSARELLARVQAAIRLAKVRRESDRMLREESLRILRLLEQAPSFICVLRGPDHVFEFANAAYRRIVGQRDLIGRTLREVAPEVAEQGFIDLLDRVYAGGRFVGEAVPMRLDPGSDGTPAASFVDFIYEPIAEADGTISGVFVEGYEVTDRVRAEQALRHSEEQLRLATEAAEVGLWDVDGVTGALYWPPRVNAMFGISPDRPVTMDDFYTGLHPEDREATTAAYEAAADPARRALYDVEFRTVGKEDGVVRWVAAKGRGVFDDEGRCMRIIGTAIDITRRKADEARLRELNETLERRVSEALAERKILADVVEGTDAFVQVADLDYNWMAINKAAADEFERKFGQRPRPGDNMLALLADRPAHAAAVKAVWSRALAGEEFTQIDEFGDPGIARRWYEMKFNVLRDHDGSRIGAYQFVYDVTDRLRDQVRLAEAEAALRQAQKLEAMGQLTGGVAHDFNNLLTPILGALDLLHRRRVGGAREQRLVAAALQSGERAKTLVQRLLAFARRQPLQPGAVDVRSVIEGMAELVRSTTGPQIRVLIEVAADLPPARADANQLEMAILNLSVNARDAMEQGGGLLRISADAQDVAPAPDAKLQPGRYVRVSVADSGVGMTKEVAAKAVEPFFSTKAIGKGTGLGLSMVHGLASQLGGGLVIDSQPGQGATIELWLPQSDQPFIAAIAETVKPSAAPHGAGQALVVDDEALVRGITADMLTEMGYAVVEASSAEEALDLLGNGRQFDVVITDHLMPGMSGAALAYEMRSRWPLIRTVIISGYAGAEGIGPDLLRLTKPFRQSDLAAILAEPAFGVSA